MLLAHRLHARWVAEGRPIPAMPGWRWSYVALLAVLRVIRVMSWFRTRPRVKSKPPPEKMPEAREKEHASTLGKKPSTPQHKGQLMSRVNRLLKNRGC